MSNLSCRVFSLIAGALLSSSVLADSLIEFIPDSPPYHSYSTDTWLELGWTSVTVAEHRGVSGFTIEYDWNTLESFFGTFYAKSPAGTVYFIGFAEEAGHWIKNTDDFDDQWADGDWIFWVEDVNYGGEQQATGITWQLDYVDADQPFALTAETQHDAAQLSWSEAVETTGFVGYRVYRNGAPIADTPDTAYVDADLELGNYCYTVAAVYGDGAHGPSPAACTEILPPGVYGLPDGPDDFFAYHSYWELGWTDFVGLDAGTVESCSIAFTWTNVNGFTDGSLHIESPNGTLVTVATGIANGTYAMTVPAVVGEPAHGLWKVWLEDDDTFGDGRYRVTDATVTFAIDQQVPTDLSATTEAAGIRLDWIAPADDSGLLQYDLTRDGAPVATLAPGTLTWLDTDLTGNPTWCYQITAVYGKGDHAWPLDACAGVPGVVVVSDSPPPNQPNTYYCNSYSEAGWLDLDVPDLGVIDGWQIDFTWDANWAVDEGRFYVRSPGGTQLELIDGDPDGQYSIPSSVFDGEPSVGLWKIWIVDNDFFCDGMFRATNIWMTFTQSVTGDVDGDGVVGFSDLIAVLATWGVCSPPPTTCPADLDGNGAVDFNDLLIVLGAWTP